MLANILKNKKLIIFDLDGTLIDSVGIWNYIDHEIIKELSGNDLALSTIGHNRDKVIGTSKSNLPYQEYFEYLIKTYNFNITLEELIQYRRHKVDDFLINQIQPRPYAKNLIDTLYDSGITLALATTTNKRCLDIYKKYNIKTSSLDFSSKFTLILCMEDVKKYKPHPEIHEQILNTLGFSREKTLIIEDSRVGLEAAKRASIDVIIVAEEHSQDDAEYLCKNANYYIENLGCLLEYYLKMPGKSPKSLKKD